MSKNVTQAKKRDMQLHIEQSYNIINEFLPTVYLSRVREKLPKSCIVSDGAIRNIRNKSHKPNSKIEVLNALVEVALENKSAIEKLEAIK
jgi:hypothetical protein